MCIENAIYEILFSQSMERMSHVKQTNKLFAHYTSADTALKIIQEEEMWMRNVSDMNDFSEIILGQRSLIETLKEKQISDTFDAVITELSSNKCSFSDIISYIENMSDIREQLYISCFSEHRKDDLLGRLSMWRAYAPQNGVALLINASILDTKPIDNVLFWTAPVQYLHPENLSELRTNLLQIAQRLLNTVKGQKNNIEICDFLCSTLIGYFYVSSASIKHIGFSEEEEWRVLFSTKSQSSEMKDILVKSIENIVGLPQTIYKICLKNLYANELDDMVLVQKLLKKVIIGPSKNPKLIQEAFCDTLRDKGVLEPEKMVVISDIPVRL